MDITRPALEAIRVGFETRFQEGFAAVPMLRDRVAEVVTSTSLENLYGWLGDMPGLREWIGPRVVHGLRDHDYRLKNRDFELTIAVGRNAILDDTIGTYGLRFTIMGRSAARWPEDLVWEALRNAHLNDGYDGQPFFDSAHPVLAANGATRLVSNIATGAGPAWFLMDTSAVVKPIIFQDRQAPVFTARDSLDDDNVFFNKEFIYGVDARGVAGYGFWQTAFRSTKPLDAASYEEARVALSSMRGDYDRPLAIMPNLLVVPPQLEGAANRVVKNALVGGGNTNEWVGTAEVLSVPYLA